MSLLKLIENLDNEIIITNACILYDNHMYHDDVDAIVRGFCKLKITNIKKNFLKMLFCGNIHPTIRFEIYDYFPCSRWDKTLKNDEKCYVIFKFCGVSLLFRVIIGVHDNKTTGWSDLISVDDDVHKKIYKYIEQMKRKIVETR